MLSSYRADGVCQSLRVLERPEVSGVSPPDQGRAGDAAAEVFGPGGRLAFLMGSCVMCAEWHNVVML